MAFLHINDTINGKEGTVTANIQGNIEDMIYVKSLEATLKKKKKELNVLSYRGTQHKTTGWAGTGKITSYYVTSAFRKLASEYNKTGKDIYFTITVTNEDATSTLGKQTIVLYYINFDDIVLAKIAVDDEVLEEDMSFTFSDFEILDEFGNPVAQD